MSYHWNPTKKEIRDLWLKKEQWLDRYLSTESHKIFFCSFPIELYEWIVKLADNQGRWKLDGPIVWTLELVRKLEASEDKITHVIDHWLDHVIGGFLFEFAVDTPVKYSEAKRCFFKGPRGKYLKSLNTWIKMLLCKKRVMQLPWCSELREAKKLTRTNGERILNIVH